MDSGGMRIGISVALSLVLALLLLNLGSSEACVSEL